MAGGDFGPAPQPPAARPEDPRRRGCLARRRLRGCLRGHPAPLPVLVRGRPRGPRLRRPLPLLLLPARGDRDAGVAGGDRRPARRPEAHSGPRDDLREGSLHQEHHVPDHDGRPAAASPLRAGGRRRGPAGPPARGPAPLRLQDGHRLGQDLGGGDGHRLGPLPQAAGAGIGAVHQLPDRGAERDRVPAAGTRLRRESHLLRAALDPAGVARRVRAEGDLARRGREPVPPATSSSPTSSSSAVARRNGRRRTHQALLARSPRKTSPPRARARCWS